MILSYVSAEELSEVGSVLEEEWDLLVGSDGGEVVDGSQKSGTTELWVSSNTSSGDTEEAGSEDGLDNSARFEVTFESALLGEAGDEGHDRLGDGVGVVLDLLVVVVFVLEDDKLEEGEEGNEDLKRCYLAEF